MKKTVFNNEKDFINYCDKCYDENKEIDWYKSYSTDPVTKDKQEEEWIVIEKD